MRRPILLLFAWCTLFGSDRSLAQPWPTPAGNPGPRIADCESALRPGWTRCTTAAQRVLNGLRKQRLDAEISAFLAGYGKPPREAVRALLDPTDDNIRAWIRAQRKTLSVAAYVAQRMTALQQENSPDGAATTPTNPPPGIGP